MIFHILNGDSIAYPLNNFNLKGEFITCRECLIDGPASSDINELFWKKRADYIYSSYNESPENYSLKVKNELKRIEQIPQDSEIYLWFEDDLYCQANMWFIVSLIAKNNSKVNVYRIFPSLEDAQNKWKGFSNLNDSQVKKLLDNKIKFTRQDIDLAKNLWHSYAENNFENLMIFSKTKTACFRFLQEVITAHIERFSDDMKEGRPERTLKRLISDNNNSFAYIFSEFKKTEAIYGFGDLQIKLMLKNLSGCEY